MALTIGTQLGSHEITALLGKGGMGEVYRARDLKLKRDVAIKILPEEFSREPDRVSRLQREAEILASLNHTNIAAIYDLQESLGSQFLVLELVEGETLAERIARGSIPVEEALPISKQILEALEAAHGKGIVHRDLKPANVKILPDGKVKVLDFGLAKGVNKSPANSTLSNSPTLLSMPATHAGMILGTAAYMSPEQARGLDADSQSDIFSFGCVLYEMLSGHQSFQGDTVSDVLASVLAREPDFTRLPGDLNPALPQLLRRCLDKNRKKRWHCAGDLQAELEMIAANPHVLPMSAPQSAGIARPWWRRAMPVLAVTLTLIVVAVSAWNLKPSKPAAVTRFLVLPPENLKFAGPIGIGPTAGGAISPDGRKLAFTAGDSSGKKQLWVRGIDDLTAQPLGGTDDASFPFWSPDSRFIAFFAHEKLLKIEAAGGTPQTLCDAQEGRGGAWSRDGVILFGLNQAGPLRRVSSAGGLPTKLSEQKGITDDRFPSFLPDGRHFLFYANAGTIGTVSDVYAASLDSPELKVVLSGLQTSAIYVLGYLVFVRDNTLFAQSFNTRTLTVSGDPFPIAEERVEIGPTGVLSFSVSENGVLAYGIRQGSSAELHLVWVNRQGKEVETLGPSGNYRGINIGLDGKRIVTHRHDGQGGDIWLTDLSNGVDQQLTFDASQDNSSPVFSPDGSQVAFASRRSGNWGLYIKPSSGGGNEDLLLQLDSRFAAPVSWSPDGSTIVYNWQTGRGGQTRGDLWAVPVNGDGKPRAVVDSQFAERNGQISPDGKWIAYQSDETGQFETYVQPFPAGNGKWRVSSGGGYYPRWRGDGRELFYMDRVSSGNLVAVEVQGNDSDFRRGTPKALFETRFLLMNHPGQAFVASPNGQRFLIPYLPANAAVDPLSAPIAVVTNWFEELKARAGGKN